MLEQDLALSQSQHRLAASRHHARLQDLEETFIKATFKESASGKSRQQRWPLFGQGDQYHNTAHTLQQDDTIIHSNHPSAWLKSLASTQTWTNREIEWQFLGQRRLLFACDSASTANAWVLAITQALSRQPHEVAEGLYEDDEALNDRCD